ncbi:UvrD-helicase domain-containing protein [Solidesulfovibrio sp.]|uniref:UvrD-helicase domain-containing protein n=1 Tax=Solidesulfovibrio sp. TaxID=2910990 RepID=UPI002B2071D8|nr:UvrD-helicase domain-containing protein [Solidesulfovibrio sp.]MEA4855564.1 UvrD-helicase domain-containing protein [Solidesulfovibrio sp.]
MLIQVKASAGSGKTHALTERFISLALRSGSRLPRACADSLEHGYALPEILAVTFTNKAAAEMRERVLSRLKTMALGLGGADAAQRGKARDELEDLLVHAERLNIRTIDSLLFLLARIFALELGLRPDFEPAFDMDDILSDLYDRLAARLPEDPALARGFGEAAAALLREASGFFPLRRFRERARAVAGKLRAEPFAGAPAEAEALRLGLERRLGALSLAAGGLLTALDTAGLKADSRFLTFLRRCRDADQADAPPRSAYVAKPGLADCLLKASRDAVPPGLDALFAALRAAHGRCARDLPVLRAAMAATPFIALAERFAADFPAYLTQMRVLPHVLWPRLVAARLAGDQGVPDAWCRLGAGLAHMLIDEFQDTAGEQWGVLRLLAAECLARGGSLYLVGDVKQAIYGWRGGDAALFDAAPADPELARMTDDVVKTTLPINWRSAPEVVETNNRFFGALADPDTAGRVAEALLGPALGPAAPELARSLARAFADAGQRLPADRLPVPGHVRVTALPADSIAAYEEAAREELLRLLAEELVPRHGHGGVAVLPRSNTQATRVASWLVGAGLPVVTENSLRLADHPLIRQLAAMLAFLDYPPDNLSFFAFVSGRELFGDLAGISREELADWLATLPGRGSLSLAFAARFPDPWQRLVRPFLRQTGLAGPYDLLREIVAGYRLLERRPGDEAFLRRFLEIAHLAESRGHGSISAFLDFWNTLGDDEKVPQPENVGAVRIMTIHKAKGLQFPAVVVPFHHFPGRSGEAPLVAATVEEGQVLVPDQAGLGPDHARRRAGELAEQVHLLYVAWTRPEAELHAFVPGRGKLREERYPLARALGVLFAAFGHDPADGEPIRVGAPETTPAPPPAACPVPDETDTAEAPAAAPPEPLAVGEPMAWLPRLRVYRNVADDVRRSLFSGEKRRGELAHLAAELFVKKGFDPADPGPAARAAALSALGNERLAAAARREMAEDFTAMLAWLAGLPQVRDALAHGLTERELIDAAGARLRPDLLWLGPEATVVLDFKTGREEPGHAAQVARYLALAGALPGRAGKPGRGVLVYLDKRLCRDVEAAS